MAAPPDTGIDMLLGIGGTPAGIITACAMQCTGGMTQGQLAQGRRVAAGADAGDNLDDDHVMFTSDPLRGDDSFFVATGITDGNLKRGVRRR